MDYASWIERERRLRTQLLRGSPVISERGAYRVCSSCAEVCLCHEMSCPNCGSTDIAERPCVEIDPDLDQGLRIRCLRRFERIRQRWEAPARDGAST